MSNVITSQKNEFIKSGLFEKLLEFLFFLQNNYKENDEKFVAVIFF